MAVYRRFTARRATIFLKYVSQGIPLKRAQGIAVVGQKTVASCAPSAGAGENALVPSRSFIARGALGVAVGVRATDSHALSNTWESVHQFGLLGNGVVI